MSYNGPEKALRSETTRAREIQGCPRTNPLLDGLALSRPGPVTGREEDGLCVLVREAACLSSTPQEGVSGSPTLTGLFRR